MPILEDPRPGSPLTQGDILARVYLYATGADWSSDKPEKVASSGCIVVSRPCVAAHKPHVIVAPVVPHKDSTPKDDVPENFSEVCDFLKSLREGALEPDNFYLGQIAALGQGRYRARLDSLCMLKLPPALELAAFLRDTRVATLSGDFARDLHVRLFAAFARLGFDDYGWYADKDLDWAVQMGEKELQSLRATYAKYDAEGDAKKVHVQKTMLDMERKLKPLKDELASRKAGVGAVDAPFSQTTVTQPGT